MQDNDLGTPEGRGLDRPISLLSVVRDHIADNIAPEVDSGRRYDVLMALAALDIVLRELSDGEETLSKAADALSEALGEKKRGNYSSLEDIINVLTSRISREVREGRHDGSSKVHSQLLTYSSALLEEANPKYQARLKT